MSVAPISPSPDIQRLRNEGYEVEIREKHLMVHSVPYVNAKREVARGTLVTPLTMAGDVIAPPVDHITNFIGDHPCTTGGTEIAPIKNASEDKTLAPGIEVNHTFSNKPPQGYKDYHEKMTRYIEIISAPARALDSEVTAQTYKPVETRADEETVFKYHDTATSRAGTSILARRLEQQCVAIVGLGGTGSYVLDLLAKTPVKEIHLYDADGLLSHNAFRAPGAPSIDELRAMPAKVDHLHGIYSRMRTGIVPHRFKVTEGNVHELFGCDFVFLCVDNGSSRKLLAEKLHEVGVAFIDTGMGVGLVSGDKGLSGICRVTAVTPAKNDHMARLPMGVGQDDEYASNIQIAELNALCAILAVIRWKKLRSFYVDLEGEHHATFSIDTCQLDTKEAKL